MNRIEEAKKILDSWCKERVGIGCPYNYDCERRSCNTLLARQICQLFPQPLDGIKHPQCNHKDKRCSNMEKQKGVDYGRCLLRNSWDCPFGFSPQPLDDKGLREKIEAMRKESAFCPDIGDKLGYCGKYSNCDDCIWAYTLVLLQPKIEEARIDEQERLLRYLKGLLESTPKASLAATIDLIETMGEKSYE